MRHLGHYFAVLVVTISLLAAMIVAAGCGGPSAAQRAKTRSLQATYLEQGAVSFERKQNIAKAKSASARCNSKVSVAMRDLHAAKKIESAETYNLQRFWGKVEGANTAIQKISPDALDQSCFVVYSHAIDLLTNYVDILQYVQDTASSGHYNKAKMGRYDSAASKNLQKMDAAFAAIARPKEVGTSITAVPLQAAQVQASVYGRALVDFCGSNAPADAVKPCADLRKVLADGVTDKELGTLDDAVSKLNKAYHFDTA